VNAEETRVAEVVNLGKEKEKLEKETEKLEKETEKETEKPEEEMEKPGVPTVEAGAPTADTGVDAGLVEVGDEDDGAEVVELVEVRVEVSIGLLVIGEE
jgi:sRNA-binding protein